MKIAYLVFAYRNPLLLERVIAKLSIPGCEFFLHIDGKTNIEEFRNIRGDQIHFCEKRVVVNWAEFSGVRAILLLLRAALAAPGTYDYFVLLSGSEYPLKSAGYIRSFLSKHYGLELISLVKIPNESAGKPLCRINTVRMESSKPIRRFAVRALAKLGVAQRDYRNYLGDLAAYSGNTWWVLTRGACQYIADFVETNPHVEKYFQDTFAPEEMFFHTILGNSAFASRIRRNVLYEDWVAEGAHPAMITARHVSHFESEGGLWLEDIYGSGEALFARKFDDHRSELLERIDEMIRRNE
jgi:hypothetical protein